MATVVVVVVVAVLAAVVVAEGHKLIALLLVRVVLVPRKMQPLV